jgi:DNA polymerase-3 subunit gamma/tau
MGTITDSILFYGIFLIKQISCYTIYVIPSVTGEVNLMSYIALYRQWRPTRFEDVVEQEHVVKTLRHSVNTGRIAHAYLFCGTRGTGKTTMAHILSRAINCLNPDNGDPCNKCDVCREILDGSSVDVLEIDAASNNSVDNVRSIRDEVIYTPTKAKYKVYIIDEVHMLSTGAFNALLKTLEEPPEHVVFILATTEPHKLPATILSRCQRFDFRRISQESIVKRLDKIAAACGTSLDTDAARLIARMSDGAMRDAISLLDQCISLGGSSVGYDDVLSVVGIVNDEFITDFVKSMLDRDIPKILENIGRLIMDGRDISHFVSDIVMYFRNLLICKATGGRCESLVDAPTAVLEIMKKQSEIISREKIIKYVKELSSLEASLKWASNPRILLEVTLIKLCGNESTDDTDVLDRLAAIEERINSGNIAINHAPPTAKGSSRQQERSSSGSTQQNTASGAGPVDPRASSGSSPVSSDASASAGSKADKVDLNTADEFKEWPKVMEYLRSMGRMKIYSFLHNAKAVQLDENNIGIVFSQKDSFTKTLVSKPEHMDLINEAIQKVTGKDIKAKCVDEHKLSTEVKKPVSNGNEELVKKAMDIAANNGLTLEILDE